jgi:predicted ATP-grasp superfamily ATP-dependent carboligase
VSVTPDRRAEVLLTYGWCRTAYCAARDLARHGVSVVVGDTGNIGMCQWSRIPSSTFRYRDPSSNPIEFVSDVAAACEEHQIKVIIPGHDEIEVLAQHANGLPSGVVLAAAEHNSLQRANNKAIVAARAVELDIPVAPMVHYERADALVLATSPERRYVARTLRSNSSKGFLCSRGGQDLANAVQSLIDRHALSPTRLPIVQEFVGGDGWGVSCLYWNGEPIAHFSHRRVEEKVASGGTSTLRTSESNPVLTQYAHTLLRDMKWHGLAMVEFKYDSASNRGWLVEINPRLWGSLDLAIQSGVNFPYLLFLAATAGSEVARKAARPQRNGVMQMWLLGDLLRRIDAVSRGRIAHAIGIRGLLQARHFDDLKLDDPGAFLGELMYYIRKFVKLGSLNPIDNGMVN